MRHHPRFGLALAGAALLLFTSACDSADNTDPMTTSRAIQVDRDLDLRSELLRISGSRESARLADLTPWSWTEVYVFAEGATAETIAAQTGSRIIQDRYYDAGNLLVFVENGVVVHVSSIVPDLLVTRGQYAWPQTVRLSPHGDSTPALLRLSTT